MTRQQITGGAWFLHRTHNSQFENFMLCSKRSDGSRVNIAEVYGWGEEPNANARLLLAAPNMLAMLHRVRGLLSEDTETKRDLDCLLAEVNG